MARIYSISYSSIYGQFYPRKCLAYLMKYAKGLNHGQLDIAGNVVLLSTYSKEVQNSHVQNIIFVDLIM